MKYTTVLPKKAAVNHVPPVVEAQTEGESLAQLRAKGWELLEALRAIQQASLVLTRIESTTILRISNAAIMPLAQSNLKSA